MSFVISNSELERMRASTLPAVDDLSRTQKRDHLKKLSEDRVKNWPNTLEAMRRKKESYLKDKADQEELKRQEIDREVYLDLYCFCPSSVILFSFFLCVLSFLGS